MSIKIGRLGAVGLCKKSFGLFSQPIIFFWESFSIKKLRFFIEKDSQTKLSGLGENLPRRQAGEERVFTQPHVLGLMSNCLKFNGLKTCISID